MIRVANFSHNTQYGLAMLLVANFSHNTPQQAHNVDSTFSQR